MSFGTLLYSFWKLLKPPKLSAPTFTRSCNSCDCVMLQGIVDFKKGRLSWWPNLIPRFLKSREFWRLRWANNEECRRHQKLKAVPTWQPVRKQGPQTYGHRNWILPTICIGSDSFPAPPDKSLAGQYFDFVPVRHWGENAAQPAQISDLQDCAIKYELF